MEIEKIKTGKITEQELVELFGTPAQKQSYKDNGRFIGNYKQSLLKKVARYCDIKDLSNHTYRISNVYKFPIPSNFNKMTNSLYQYICPLLLNYLVNGHDEHHKIDITVGKWSRAINMVNVNYDLVKYNKEDTAKEIQYPLDLIYEFYDKADDMLNWYIITALDYLKSAGLIIWREAYRVNIEVSNINEAVIDENGNIHVDISIDNHQASDEEMEYYTDCVKIADREAGIENDTERYYSKKTKHFNEVLKKELYKRKIKSVYKTYEAYYINPDKCAFVLSQFGNANTNKLTTGLNTDFTNMIIENAGKRFNRMPNKYWYCRGEDDYKSCFQGLCEITINKNTEYIGDRIQAKLFQDNYHLDITKK